MQIGTCVHSKKLQKFFVFHMCCAWQRESRVQPLLLLITKPNLFFRELQSKQVEDVIRFWKSEVQRGIIICLVSSGLITWDRATLFSEIQLWGGLVSEGSNFRQSFKLPRLWWCYELAAWHLWALLLALLFSNLLILVLVLHIFLETTTLGPNFKDPNFCIFSLSELLFWLNIS